MKIKRFDSGIPQPEDKGIYLKDILEQTVDGKYFGGYNPSYKSQSNHVHNIDGKSNVIHAGTHGYSLGVVKVPMWEVDRDKSYAVDANYFKGGNKKRYTTKHSRQLVKLSGTHIENHDVIIHRNGHGYIPTEVKAVKKSDTLREATSGNYRVQDGCVYRKLTPVECERLQTFPDNWTSMVSNTQRYKQCGNSWTVDVIVHIFGYLKRK